jgi:hypothetical protein
MRIITVNFLLILGLFASSIALAEETVKNKVIAGWIETVSFTKDDLAVYAKLDTGAKTSSIHATNIKKMKKNNEDWVSFTLVLQGTDDNVHKVEMEAPKTRKVLIKKHGEESDERLAVDLNFCFNDEMHTAEFTLANRKKYNYSVLLGRSFMKEVVLVDPSNTFLLKSTCN